MSTDLSCTMSATRYSHEMDVVGAVGSTTQQQICKIGYLRKLKGWFNEQRSSPESRLWSLRHLVNTRLTCQPYNCKCRQRRFLLRFLCPLESEQTMKKKFFVLRAECGSQPACLEYYENEKKWKAGSQPKRSIMLKTCFNINRKLDVKQKHALALYTKDDCFTLILENEEELESWLNSLLALQQGDEQVPTHQPPKPTFEHVWQVNVKNRGLANSKNIVGAFHLCLTSQTLSLVKLNTEIPQVVDFPLISIRRCGHSYCFFFMELGRSAITGSGELWMQTEDVVIAQNMHETILNAMRLVAKDEVAPRQRSRSSSTTESSKPINMHPPRRMATVLPPIGLTTSPTKRERSDSVPSRPRTISDGPSNARKSQPWNFEVQRPHSMYSHPSSYSPPLPPSITTLPSPSSFQRAADSGGSSVSIDEHDTYQSDLTGHKHETHKSSITEEKTNDDYLPMTPSDTFSCKIEDNNNIEKVNNKSTSPNLTDYMDMLPSTVNSPADSEGYMQMSPVGSHLSETWSIKSLTPAKSFVTSRKTSLEKEAAIGGYVSMAPLSATSSKAVTPDTEGYMDMKPTNKEKNDQDEAYLNMCCNTKSSDDMRFSEFQLEKVRTYFTSAEEDEKLVRAYSVGSKSNHKEEESSSRVRAFSVGSKVGIEFRKKETAPNQNISTTTTTNEKKSWSAPLLTTSWSPTSPLSKATFSPTRNEDLMEMDFAKSVKHGDGHQSNKFRCRSNTRTRPAEWLQSIGENSNSSLESGTKKKSNDYSEMATTHTGEYVNIDLEKNRPVKIVNESCPYENISVGTTCHTINDKELNYASLDLVSTKEPTPPHSPKSGLDDGLSYASIDFSKSEGLRNTTHTVRQIRQKST